MPLGRHDRRPSRSLRGSADRNTVTDMTIRIRTSLPSRERGSKRSMCRIGTVSDATSLPSRERGSKHSRCSELISDDSVAPFAGARIETITTHVSDQPHAERGRSLRGSADRNTHSRSPVRPARHVAPFAGARIETQQAMCDARPMVAPFAGARIETMRCRHLRARAAVAPFAGARIETSSLTLKTVKATVAPFAGARIETALWHRGSMLAARSLPSRERGSKHVACSTPRAPSWSLPSRERGSKLRRRT